MPNYFDEYDTTVHFISEEELMKNHSGLAHGGFVIRSGRTGHQKEHNHIIEFNLKLARIDDGRVDLLGSITGSVGGILRGRL